MRIRKAELTDFEEIVKMYKDLLAVVYEGLKISEDIFIYATVIDWYKSGKDIMVCETDDGDIAGFTLAYVENLMIIEPYYRGDIAYVKPEYRKTRAAYLMYHDVVNHGHSLGLKVESEAYVGNGNKESIDKIQSRFGEPQFIKYMTKGNSNG